MSGSGPRLFDRRLLACRRDRAAAGGDRAAGFLLDRWCDDLLDRLAAVRRRFPVAVDLGAHDGRIAAALARLPGTDRVIRVDASRAMLARGAGPAVAADPECLPFADASLDLVVSGLALHLVDDLPGALLQVRRALRPDGLMIAGLLGGATLAELRGAMAEAEAELAGGVSPRVAPFADVRALGALLQRAGFALPVADADAFNVTYPSALHLMRDLKAMGASNMLAERRRVPATRGLLARAAAIYAERHGRPDGRVPATFEIVTLTGWAPDPSQQQPLKPGSARARLADALGTPERAAGDNAGGPRD